MPFNHLQTLRLVQGMKRPQMLGSQQRRPEQDCPHELRAPSFELPPGFELIPNYWNPQASDSPIRLAELERERDLLWRVEERERESELGEREEERKWNERGTEREVSATIAAAATVAAAAAVEATRENASTPKPNADGPPFSSLPFQPIPYLPMPPPPGISVTHAPGPQDRTGKAGTEQAEAVVAVAVAADEEVDSAPSQTRILQHRQCLMTCSNSLTIENAISRDRWVAISA